MLLAVTVLDHELPRNSRRTVIRHARLPRFPSAEDLAARERRRETAGQAFFACAWPKSLSFPEIPKTQGRRPAGSV
jgi:hypothetical protein